MQTASLTPEAYVEGLPEDRKKAMNELREGIRSRLPKGFSETVTGGMICYAVPHSLYPAGYHCNPEQPLPFISIASQKNSIVVYHMGLYASESLLEWFTSEYARRVKTKLDMGKSCIRFKKPDAIPFDLMGELASKMSPQQWIDIYESVVKR